MNSTRLKYEGWLYELAFLIALAFRLIQLGASPLNDSEAALAMQALQIARGAPPLLGPQPAYILLTSLLFSVIESTNFIARSLPAIAGSALVFAPFLFREKLKPRPALVLAFLFAIDPGLVALSRLAGGTILAITFTLFAWGMWAHRRPIPAGIFAGLALLSGNSIWMGLVAFGLVWLFVQGLGTRQSASQSEDSTSSISEGPESSGAAEASQDSNTSYPVRHALLAMIATLVLVGTLFFLVPNGLSAWASSLPAYLSGWVAASVMTPARTAFTLLVYEPLGLFFAILSLIRGFRTGSQRIIRLSIWLGVSLLLAIFYRQPGELAWVILPLLALASLEISHSLNISRSDRLEVGVVATVLLILLAYIWFDIAAIGLDPFSQFVATLPGFGSIQNPRYVILYGALGILVLCILFVAFGWSSRIARLGAEWAFLISLTVYSLGAAWDSSGVRNRNAVELWTPDQKPAQADLLLASVKDVSEMSLGHDQSQPVAIVGVDSAALEWLLRDHFAEQVSALDPQSTPPIIITPPMDNLSLPAAYRGQDFTWRQRVQYESMQRPEWWRWLVNRQLPRENETIILWARDDLFPDARQNPQ
ncbi:MAG TPA: hypothetical protein VJ785_12155 [Anaerolineales bacterium]|nr:hypothetical protein [Anaerolineales bacterium]